MTIVIHWWVVPLLVSFVLILLGLEAERFVAPRWTSTLGMVLVSVVFSIGFVLGHYCAF